MKNILNIIIYIYLNIVFLFKYLTPYLVDFTKYYSIKWKILVKYFNFTIDLNFIFYKEKLV